MVSGLSAMRYAGVNARIRGLYSRLLPADTWRDLVIAQGLPAVITLLRSTGYADVVTATEQGGRLTLEQLERRLLGHAAENIRLSMTFTSDTTYRLLAVWWQHFELENLKALFRVLDQRMEPDLIRRFLIPLGDYSRLPWDALRHEHSVPSLIDRLSNTHYINPLRAAFPIYQREHSLFALELALDIRYYRDLGVAIKHLHGDDAVEARRILGTRLDMLNILWAFRYRVYYKLSAEEIVNYTLWHTLRTNTDIVRDIALGADPRDILVRVWGDRAFDFTELQGYTDEARMLPALELLLERYWRRLAGEEMGGFPLKLGTLLGYLVLQELEIQDLVTLLEGKGMDWDPERINAHLIRRKE